MEQLVLELASPPEPKLDNYIAGSNAGALAALAAALAGQEPVVFLWGETGSGKTHLAQAFVHAAVESGREARYLHASRIHALDTSMLQVLALDEVDALDPDGQLLAFDAVNRLRLAGGVLLATGRFAPAGLALREDLRTRLGAGIVRQLTPLNDAEKRAALEAHAKSRALPISPELLDYMLSRRARDMRTQIAILDALDRASLTLKRPLTLPLVREALKSLE